MAKAPLTTSNLTERPAMGAPPGPVTVTEAVAVCPEQIEFAPHAAEAGLTTRVLKIGAARTVTVAEPVCPVESCAVMTTGVSDTTFAGSRTMVPVVFVCATGRIAELLETIR